MTGNHWAKKSTFRAGRGCKKRTSLLVSDYTSAATIEVLFIDGGPHRRHGAPFNAKYDDIQVTDSFCDTPVESEKAEIKRDSAIPDLLYLQREVFGAVSCKRRTRHESREQRKGAARLDQTIRFDEAGQRVFPRRWTKLSTHTHELANKMTLSQLGARLF